MEEWLITTESGSDMTPETAQALGVEIVPMHISLGDETFDDGSFPPERICTFYEEQKKLPKTSGCTPDDFERFFDRIHAEHPQARILHLAYSAVTTVSYSSACIAAEERPYVTVIDTQHVSAGLQAVVIQVCQLLKEQPGLDGEAIAAAVQQIVHKTRMCFVPGDLKFLHAGGRCGNLAFVGGQLLKLHPCIEILDGKLIATKKYRGSLHKVIPQVIQEYAEKNNLDRKQLWLIRAVGLSEELQALAEQTAHDLGFVQVDWVWTGCVITAHGGPGAFGVVGLSAQA